MPDMVVVFFVAQTVVGVVQGPSNEGRGGKQKNDRLDSRSCLEWHVCRRCTHDVGAYYAT